MKSWLVLFVCFVLAVSLGFAEDAALTLEDARNLAVANSRELRQLAMSVESSEITRDTQWYEFLPSLSLQGSAGTSLWNDGKASQEILKDNFYARAGLTASEKIPLWDGGKYSIQKLLNELSAESAKQDALAGYFSVLDQVDNAYYSVLEAAANLEVAESSLETASISLSIAEIRYQNKMIVDADYFKAMADAESGKNNRDNARRNLELAGLKLKNLLGLKTLPQLAPVDFDAYKDLLTALSAISGSGIETVYTQIWKVMEKNNPDIIKAGFNLTSAEKNVTLARRSYLPELSASLSTGLNYSYTNNASGFSPFSGEFSVSGSIPLDFWITKSNVKKTRLAQERQALSYQSLMENLDIELQSGIFTLIAQAGSVLSSQKVLEYSQKQFNYVFELYTLLQNSLSDLSEAESQLRSNKTNVITSQYSFLKALSKIRSLGAFENGEEKVLLSRSLSLEQDKP
ncbi:MAG: TolC family protein [Treponema sp.]|nr:TolC family protein [Treponema sp.]